LSLENCRTVRNEMLEWEIDNGLIVEEGKYFRVQFLFPTNNIDWNTEKPYQLSFHSSKVNIATAFSIYDRIVKNEY